MKQQQHLRLILAAIFMLLSGLLPLPALAAQSGIADGTCTTDPQFYVANPAPGTGLISTIVTNVQAVLSTVAQTMFQTITVDAGYIAAVSAALTLYIVIYGVLFTLGMVQITIYDFMLRMVKIGIIALLLSPGAWDFFSGTVVTFFNCGTDDIINIVTGLATGAAPTGMGTCSTSPPFAMLDNAMAQALSAKMAVTLMAVFATGPYGILIGLLLLLSLGSFLKAMMNALWVYLMSLVLKTLLFALAPIFLPCILYPKTRHIFDGWFNQIVNATFQPILVFVFMAFFVVLILACLLLVLGVPVCWVRWSSIQGTPFSEHFWRFALWNPVTGQYEPYGGVWGWLGAQSGSLITPIDPMIALTLYLLSELAGKFIGTAIEIARNLANASTDLRMGADSIASWFTSTTESAPKGTGRGRATGGGRAKAGGAGGGAGKGAGAPGGPRDPVGGAKAGAAPGAAAGVR